MEQQLDQLLLLGVIAGVIALAIYLRRWRGGGFAHGTARWADENFLRKRGMLDGRGLPLARTLKGLLISLPDSIRTHVLLVGPTGAGKGVSIIIPWLLSYISGSLICFDPKGDLYATTRWFRRKLGKVIRLAPFSGGADTLNPLDLILPGPLLVDQARALAEAIVVRTGMENDPHWNDKAVQVITAILVFVLLQFEGEERSLKSVQDIASDPELVAAAGYALRERGGVPGRLGSQLKTLFGEE